MLDHPLPEGQTCKISIHAFFEEAQTHIIAQCRVVQAILVGMHGFRISLQFTSVDPATATLISKVVAGK